LLGIGNLFFAAPSPKVDPQEEVTNLPVALFFLSNQLIKNLIDRSCQTVSRRYRQPPLIRATLNLMKIAALFPFLLYIHKRY
jgi:hypothetical protein